MIFYTFKDKNCAHLNDITENFKGGTVSDVMKFLFKSNWKKSGYEINKIIKTKDSEMKF